MLEETSRVKRYVAVNADYLPDGSVCPHSVVFEGRQYTIERIIKVEYVKSGGTQGLRRFHVLIHGKQTSLYLENERWYVRKKVEP